MISNNDINKLEDLAKIKLTDLERERFREKLSEMDSVFSSIDDVDLSSVEPLYSVSESFQPMRDDTTNECDLSQDLLSNTPSQKEIVNDTRCFVVPKVI